MKAAIDANVLLDVMQQRVAFYDDSAACLTRAAEGTFEAVIPAHLVTTIFYSVRKDKGLALARESVGILLHRFTIASCDAGVLKLAFDLDFKDFEDAVVAAAALHSECALIVTRNTTDFQRSPVPAINPAAFLYKLDAGEL